MKHEEKRTLSAIDRRINYLRQELYTYDRYMRNPTGQVDMTGQAALAINAHDHQEELDQLLYLIGFVEQFDKPAGIKTCQALILVFYCTASVLIATVSLFLAVGR